MEELRPEMSVKSLLEAIDENEQTYQPLNRAQRRMREAHMRKRTFTPRTSIKMTKGKKFREKGEV